MLATVVPCPEVLKKKAKKRVSGSPPFFFPAYLTNHNNYHIPSLKFLT